MPDEMISEILDRSRRIETRLVSFLEAQGFDTRVRRPLFKDGCVHVQSPATSINEIMAVVPDWHNENTPVMLKDEIICWVIRPS